MRLRLKFLAKLRLLALLVMMLSLASVFAGPYSDLDRQLRRARDPQAIARIVRNYPSIANQPDIKQQLDNLTSGSTRAEAETNIRKTVEIGAGFEADEHSKENPKSEAQTLKQSPLYRDPGIDRTRNWLGNALSRIRIDPPKPRPPKLPFSVFGKGLSYLVWALLAICVVVLIYFAIQHIKWQRSLKRKVKSVLDDEEPDRTVDEWLELADAHALAGRYREAVRALYLACLLKYDEHDVARFDRGQTNWEHLSRIELSPKLPTNLDFRNPTKRFDRIWYGYQIDGQSDVDLFKGWYLEISERLKEATS